MSALPTDEMRDAAGRAICREKCAFKGEPPCWEISKYWPPVSCDEPGCATEAVAALAAAEAVRPMSEREAALVMAARLLLDEIIDLLAPADSDPDDRLFDQPAIAKTHAALSAYDTGCDDATS